MEQKEYQQCNEEGIGDFAVVLKGENPGESSSLFNASTQTCAS